MEKTKALQIKELTTIPGVGKIIAHDLWNIGYRSIRDLKGQNAGPGKFIFNTTTTGGKFKIFVCSILSGAPFIMQTL